MMSKKTIAVVMTGALVLSAFVAGPADAKKKKKPAACAAYMPGELGAEKPTLVVTDAATAEAPLVHKFSLPAYFFEGIAASRLGAAPSETINVQVDAAAATAGLHATFEFQARRDYDLFAYWPSGNEAASSHGFNPIIELGMDTPVGRPNNTATNHAGESEVDSENIIGLTTPDCGGYTVSAFNYFGEGGDFELKLWLGDATTDPKADAEG